MMLKYFCLLVFITLTFGYPSKDKRQIQYGVMSEEEKLMREYWEKEIPLGFFVNSGAADTGGAVAAETSVRNKIAHVDDNDAGSGGGEIKRDNIQASPTESLSLTNNNEKNSNEKINTEESGKLKSKLDTAQSNDADTTKADPGDKTKTRSTVTCQGQKEWLQCDGPYELIKIKSAFWGRDNDYTCTKSSITHGLHTDKTCAQDEANTMNKIKEACDNENVCEVVASPIYFDKTDCPDIFKYLKMDWECKPSESRIKESIS